MQIKSQTTPEGISPIFMPSWLSTVHHLQVKQLREVCPPDKNVMILLVSGCTFSLSSLLLLLLLFVWTVFNVNGIKKTVQPLRSPKPTVYLDISWTNAKFLTLFKVKSHIRYHCRIGFFRFTLKERPLSMRHCERRHFRSWEVGFFSKMKNEKKKKITRKLFPHLLNPSRHLIFWQFWNHR